MRCSRAARTALFALLLALPALHCFADTPAFDVEHALRARLALMEDVALDKFLRGAPIEDRERERVVLANMREQGARYGLAPERVEALGSAAINAAKSIQWYWHGFWIARRPTRTPDSIAQTRAAIDATTHALLVALAVRGAPAADGADRARRVAAWRALEVGDTEAAALEDALAAVTRSPVTFGDSTLDHIRARGVVRVGMPGDYAPFAAPSSAAAGTERTVFLGARLQGIDVDLAEQLAKSLDVDLVVVPTRWADLSSDLERGQFDIAMGGVTRTLQRQLVGLFGTPYFEDGKGAIGRCTDTARFSDFAAIDRPDVRVLVNAGGGNERFVRERIKRARIIVLQNNLEVFPALLRGDGDVMFTDTVEIRVQTHALPRLCALLNGRRLNSLHKAIYLGRDPVLQDYLDLWLVELRAAGELDATISRHLP